MTNVAVIRPHLAAVEARKAQQAAWRAANREQLLAKKRAYHHENRASLLEKMKARYQADKSSYLERARKYHEENREKEKTRLKARYHANAEVECAKRRDHYRLTKPEYVARAKARKAMLKHRLPAWADLAGIKAIYAEAEFLRSIGVDVHVDHVIPLQGATVSGLHVHNNLQILLAEENLAKRNTFKGEL